MNQLELVRRARPDVAPLDAATKERIAAAVFGEPLPAPRPPRWPKVTAVAAAIVLLVGGVAAIAWRSQPPRRLEPTAATTTTTEPATSTATAPAISGARRPWAAQFDPPPDYATKQQAALDAFMRRCMTNAGFTYVGNPFETDTEAGNAVPAEPGSYIAQWFGVDGNGGCLHLAYGNMFGQVRGDVIGSNLPGQLWGTWTRTALTDPALRAELDGLASCARRLGIAVRDVDTRPDKAYDDALDGLAAQVPFTLPSPDPVSAAEWSAARAAQAAAIDALCPGYVAYRDRLNAGIDQAALDWIAANPQKMADVAAEYADDINRFDYIVEHDGELPPN